MADFKPCLGPLGSYGSAHQTNSSALYQRIWQQGLLAAMEQQTVVVILPE